MTGCVIRAGKLFEALSTDAIFAIVQLPMGSAIAVSVVTRVKNVLGVTDLYRLNTLDLMIIYARPVKTRGLTEQH